MRKALLLVALGLVGLVGAQRVNQYRPTLEQLGASGPVQSINEYWQVAHVSFGQVTYGPRRLSDTYSFDRQGRITAHQYPLPKQTALETFSYDARGEFQGMVNSAMGFTVVVARPDDRTLIYDRYASSGERDGRVIFDLDAQGRAVRRRVYGADGHQMSEDRFTLNAAGRVTRDEHYLPSGLDHVDTYLYNARGWVTRDDPSDLSPSAFSYPRIDAHGNWTEQLISQQTTAFGQAAWEPQWRVTREITYWP